jgi:hypothetical protein
VRVDSNNAVSDQIQPAITVLNNDDFVLAWSSESASSSDILAPLLMGQITMRFSECLQGLQK